MTGWAGKGVPKPRNAKVVYPSVYYQTNGPVTHVRQVSVSCPGRSLRRKFSTTIIRGWVSRPKDVMSPW